MGTVERRQAHGRTGLRYPGDLTDGEWALVAPFVPPAERGGRRRTVDVRAAVDGIFHVLAAGCPSARTRAAPCPRTCRPKSTVHDGLGSWAWDGTRERLRPALFVQAREQAGKEASPSAAILDSQSVKRAEQGARASTRRGATPARRAGARR